MNIHNVVVARDEDGFEVVLNSCEGDYRVSCGEEVKHINADEFAVILNGDINMLCELFSYYEFVSA